MDSNYNKYPALMLKKQIFDTLKSDIVLREIFLSLINVVPSWCFCLSPSKPLSDNELLSKVNSKLEMNCTITTDCLHENLKMLYEFGLVYFSDEKSMNVDNLTQEGKKILEFSAYKIEINNYIRLTVSEERKLSGATIIGELFDNNYEWDRIIEDELKYLETQEEIIHFTELVFTSEEKIEELNKKIEDLNSNINNNLIKNIEIISIFSALIALLLANTSVIAKIAEKNYLEIAIMFLFINATLVISIFFMMLIIKKFIISSNYKPIKDKNINRFILFAFIIAILLIIAICTLILIFKNVKILII